METLAKDIRYSLRALSHKRGFAIATVLTLALGIGANTAIFSVIKAVLLSPLPYQEPDRLMVIDESTRNEKTPVYEISYPNLRELQAQNQSFEQVAAFAKNETVLRGEDGPVLVPAMMVSANLFSVVGADAAHGRTFLDSEDRPGGAAVVVVSNSFWQKRFGADADLIGKAITLDDEPYTVIGIMPERFQLADERTELWLAVGRNADKPFMMRRSVHLLTAIGRLKTNVTIAQARAEMNALAARLQEQFPGEDPGHGLMVTTLQERTVGDVRPALLMLFGAVGFLLLIACTNVANLQLTRAASRRKEFAIRAALGASRWRLIRQLLTESLLLALLGGGIGVLLALWGVDILTSLLPEWFPRSKEIGIDGSVLGFAVLLSAATGVLSGFLPALKASKANVNEALKESGGPGILSISSRLRNPLIVGEVALSLILLVGAGLMVKSFWRLTNVNPGFQADHLLTMTLSLPPSKYQTRAQVINFYKQLPDRLQAVPGVEAVSAVSALPISGGDSHGEVAIENRPFDSGEAPAASFRRILPNYFRTMGIPLLCGREFDEHDEGGMPYVTIINETMARRFWERPEAAIGNRIKVGPPEGEPWLTIVGVVGDVKNTGLEADPDLATFEPHSKRPRSTMTLVVRTSVPPLSAVASVRGELKSTDGDILIERVNTMSARISTSVAPQRLNTVLLGIFAGIALLAAAIGIYGVLASSVTQRTREIGIRIALGATTADVLTMIIGQGARLVIAGIALGLVAAFSLGLVGAFGVAKLIEPLLFKVSPTDLLTYGVVSLLLAGVALVACFVPASRAAKVDPMVALRME